MSEHVAQKTPDASAEIPSETAIPSASAINPDGTRLDPWYHAYAERALGMRQSETRALFAVADRPEVVSLAGGMPYIAGLPLDEIAGQIGDMITKQGAKALQYGSGQGNESLREHILDVVALEGITNAHADDIVITTGSQQALDLLTRIFIDPGDVILAEEPSYVGALGIFRSYQADVQHVLMDENGLIPSELEKRIVELREQGKKIKFLYTIPNYHNPAGVTLSLERRHEILDICKRHNVLIIEDNPYGLLGFDREPLPAMRAFDDEGVIYLGSFSKTFAPGFRVGWAICPHAVREKLVLASEAAMLCPSNAAQMAIDAYLTSADWKGQIKAYRDMYRERRDAMIGALNKYLPNASWNVPAGGFYVWVKLPDGLDSRAMLPRAVTQLVAYVPGTGFYYDGRGTNFMRLSFCYPTPERIVEGVRRLSQVINMETDLVNLFGTSGGEDGDFSDVETPAPNVA